MPPEGSLLHRLLTGSFKGDPEAQAKCDLLAEICGSVALGYATRLLQPRAVVLHGGSVENGKANFSISPEVSCPPAPSAPFLPRKWGTKGMSSVWSARF